jgi:hypothetical protein
MLGNLINICDHHAMLNHFQHGVTIAVCCFFCSCSQKHSKTHYYGCVCEPTTAMMTKIIALAPPARKNNNQPMMVTWRTQWEVEG